jgi:hypothetical protein
MVAKLIKDYNLRAVQNRNAGRGVSQAERVEAGLIVRQNMLLRDRTCLWMRYSGVAGFCSFKEDIA